MSETSAEREARRVAGSKPVRAGARAGLVANGIIHLLVAWLALRVAFGGSERADQGGALQTVAAEPFGRVLLWLIVAGFAAVVVWRAGEAIWGFRYVVDTGDRAKKRMFSAGQVVLFAALAVLAGRVAGGSSAGSGGQGLTAQLLRYPVGRVLVVVVGVGVLAAGVIMVYRGWQKTFTEDMDLHRAAPPARAVAEHTGQFGSMAKGVAVAIVGVLVAIAGLTYQPAQAQGLDAALKTLAAQPFGPALLVVIALGFVSYGVFAFFDARYHRV
ncbi:MAG TPA: DUF1206 domain-containing protein [Pseudonocardia sp.]|uniref:DUF1206 domain-containing protein n=1 Tax=Pseudonocardia sp. TaxID=60912 RepID=UPI002C84EA29|nr:DUF1206 domain-containing protein [Pseudonocardia sp.]HTF51117.1 DUF1206 domain-containing protein [Pseudonocardia sp.]